MEFKLQNQIKKFKLHSKDDIQIQDSNVLTTTSLRADEPDFVTNQFQWITVFLCDENTSKQRRAGGLCFFLTEIM